MYRPCELSDAWMRRTARLCHYAVLVSTFTKMTERGSTLVSFFKIDERGSTVAREIRGGVVTFFTMAYIIVLNPLILGFAQDEDGKFLGGGA